MPCTVMCDRLVSCGFPGTRGYVPREVSAPIESSTKPSIQQAPHKCFTVAVLSHTALRGSPCPCVEVAAGPWVKKGSEIYFPAPTRAPHPGCQFLHNLRTFHYQLLCPIFLTKVLLRAEGHLGEAMLFMGSSAKWKYRSSCSKMIKNYKMVTAEH